jgi:hypothetical protein
MTITSSQLCFGVVKWRLKQRTAKNRLKDDFIPWGMEFMIKE